MDLFSIQIISGLIIWPLFEPTFVPALGVEVHPNMYQMLKSLIKKWVLLRAWVQGLESGHLMEAEKNDASSASSSHDGFRCPNLRCTWPLPHAWVLGTTQQHLRPSCSLVFSSLPDGALLLWCLSTRPWFMPAFLEGPGRTQFQLNLPPKSAPPPVSPISVNGYLTKALVSYSRNVHVILKSFFSPPPPTDHQIL